MGRSETQIAKNINFEGLTFECTDYVDKQLSPGSMQGYLDAMFYMQNTQYITIKYCHLKNSGLHAISMKYSNKNNAIYGNWIQDSGYSGINIWGYEYNETGKSDCNRDHVIQNNKIINVGLHVSHGAGIALEQSGHNDISFNYVANGPRILIFGGCAWNTPEADCYFANNTFRYNDVYKGCEDTADCGNVYFWGPTYQSKYNTIDQMKIYSARWNTNPGMSNPPNQKIWGLYTDYQNRYWDIRNVVLYDIMANPPYLFYDGDQYQTVTNCSWKAGFDNSLIDYKNIGLKADFPSAYGNDGYTWKNDNDAGMTYNGTWTYRNDTPVADDFNGDEHYTTTAGAYAQYTFTGTDVKWIASTSSNRGKADVYIDNVLDSTVDLYTLGPIRQNVVYSKQGLSQGQHTIKIVVRSDKNPSSGGYYVIVDAIGYKSQSYLFYDSFESGFSNWSTIGGTPSASTARKHNGSYSYVINEDLDVIQHNMGSNTNKVAVIWFYDDASDTSLQAAGFVDNVTTPVGIGVETTTSTTKYVYRIGGVWTATTINRTTGWHKLVWDYRSGTDVKMYIDGAQIAASTAVTSFSRIYIGDAWSGSTGTVYFDDVSVQDDLP